MNRKVKSVNDLSTLHQSHFSSADFSHHPMLTAQTLNAGNAQRDADLRHGVHERLQEHGGRVNREDMAMTASTQEGALLLFFFVFFCFCSIKFPSSSFSFVLK